MDLFAKWMKSCQACIALTWGGRGSTSVQAMAVSSSFKYAKLIITDHVWPPAVVRWADESNRRRLLTLSWVFVTSDLDHPDTAIISTESRVAVQGITLDCSRSPPSWITSIDWAAFTAIVASFSCLKRVIVRVQEGTEQATAFEERARHHLVLLAKESGIQVIIFQQDYPSVSPSVMRGQSISHLRERCAPSMKPL